MFELKKVDERRGRLGETISANNDIAFEALSNLDVLKSQMMLCRAPGKGQQDEAKGSYSHKDTSMITNPYILQYLTNPKAQAQRNLSKLKAQPLDAIEKLDDFAKLNPYFDRQLVKAECD